MTAEVTGWRDERISRRHRAWGFNCPAVDLDFVMCEYNSAKPCALIEYKMHTIKDLNAGHATYRALADLATNYSGGPLPFLIAFYNPDVWSFRVKLLNDAARAHYAGCEGKTLTERQFVESLYKLRRRTLEARDLVVLGTLRDTL